MSTVEQIENAIRALSAGERARLMRDLPQLFPELDEAAAAVSEDPAPFIKRTKAKIRTPATVARMPATEGANFDWSAAQSASFPNLQPSSETISLRMPVWMLYKLKFRANQRGVPYQAHLKEILANSLRD